MCSEESPACSHDGCSCVDLLYPRPRRLAMEDKTDAGKTTGEEAG